MAETANETDAIDSESGPSIETTFTNDMVHYICPSCRDTHWTESGAKGCCA